MSIWHIYGGNRLTGSTRVQGAKNAVLPIMAASVLSGGETVLHNVPDLRDVTTTLRILQHLGCTAVRDGDTVRIDSRGMHCDFIPHALMRELRSSVIFLGAILARFGTARLSMPGGCELGPRPVNLHLDALRALGAEVTERGGDIICRAHALQGRRILLPFPSVGATENAMLAACAAAGETVLGYANFLHVLDEGDIGNVAVAPEFRRQGVADALLEALCARAAALDLAFLTLEVRASNAPAIALYRKHGFQTVGQRRNYYQKPDEDALLMTWFRREAETI